MCALPISTACRADRAAPIAKTIAARGLRTSRSFDCHSQMRSLACDGATHLSGGAPWFLVGADTMSIFGKIKDAIFGKKAVAAEPAAPAAPSPVGTALDAATQAKIGRAHV